MLYHLLYPLKVFFSPLNIFQYITFRSGAAILTSLLISFLVGPWFISYLKKKEIGQNIRQDGPKTHLGKSGTPTMGGLLILVSFISSTLLWARLDNRFILLCLAGMLWLGFLGFLDDYTKLIKKNPKGISAKTKLFWQALFAAGIAVYLWVLPSNSNFISSVNIPYIKDVFVNLSFGYMLFVFLIIVGSSNAVNLTDGLDGLAVGNLLIAAIALAFFAYFAGHMEISKYLKVVHVAGAGELCVLMGAMVGSCLGFLWFNAYPADVFMGDTGSLFLGGILGLVAVFIKQELILVVLGGVFVAEALSVMIQIISFRHFKKRIFRMSPLHHHFELGGLAESKVTVRFWIIGIILALLSFVSLKIR